MGLLCLLTLPHYLIFCAVFLACRRGRSSIHTPKFLFPPPLLAKTCTAAHCIWHYCRPHIEVNKSFFDIWKEKHFCRKFPQSYVRKKHVKVHGKANGHSCSNILMGFCLGSSESRMNIQPHQNIMFATSVAFPCLPTCFFLEAIKEIHFSFHLSKKKTGRGNVHFLWSKWQ